MTVAFDVGAHHGETAMELLRSFPTVKVHSFEPLPANFAILERETENMGTRNVNAAVTENSGTVTIELGASDAHTHVHHGAGGVVVPAVTVDDYMREQGLDRIDLLKIDVEGHEEMVLRGALDHLSSGSIEFVFCECDFTLRADEPHGHFRVIFDLLEPLGYRVVSFYTSGVDNLGWLWGDVLFRFAPEAREVGSGSTSPHVRGMW